MTRKPASTPRAPPLPRVRLVSKRRAQHQSDRRTTPAVRVAQAEVQKARLDPEHAGDARAGRGLR